MQHDVVSSGTLNVELVPQLVLHRREDQECRAAATEMRKLLSEFQTV